MAGSCERNSELWVYMKCGEFLDMLRNCWFFKSPMQLISYLVRSKQTKDCALTVSCGQQNTAYCCTAVYRLQEHERTTV